MRSEPPASPVFVRRPIQRRASPSGLARLALGGLAFSFAIRVDDVRFDFVIDVLIYRDPRESTAKCSLTPLRGMVGIEFVSHRLERRVEVGSRILLHPEGELLSPGDAGLGLLLVDCAWRRVPQMLAHIDGDLKRRRLPALETAYPRKSRQFVDPEQGLASVEALYAALAILGDRRPELLERYRWAQAFLEANQAALAKAARSSGLEAAD